MNRFLTDSTHAVRQTELRLQREALVAERRKHQKRLRFSDEAKIDVVKTYLALGGNLTLTAGATGMSRETLKDWKASGWWGRVSDELRKEERIDLSAKVKKILNKSMDLLLDRVEHGDFIYDQRKGELVRKPVKAIELHKITVDLMIQKETLDKSMESNVAPESHDDKLKNLAERFAELAMQSLKDQKAPVIVTDVVFAEEQKNGI